MAPAEKRKCAKLSAEDKALRRLKLVDLTNDLENTKKELIVKASDIAKKHKRYIVHIFL
jgi:hypothetical protein